MPRCVKLVAALVLGLLLSGLVRAQPLPTDPRLVTGELPNGLRYIVRQHNNPPGRAFVWLHVATGSLNETDRQRGAAHYLEHMAFNGSEHFPPGSVIPFFESLGLTFGQHQNAFTSFDQTTFQLALPDTKPETLDKAMQFMSDVAFRLTLPPKEIDNERQVILEERRTRLSGRQRVADYWLERLAPGSVFGERIPIGTEESIKGLTEQDFKDYYGKWYVPADMTVMVVADMDTGPIIERIKKEFGAGTKAAPPTPQDARVKPYEQTRAIVASDKELTEAEVSMMWIAPPVAPTTTVELYRRDLVDTIWSRCFNRRLQKKIQEGKVSFLGGAASSSNMFGVGMLSQIAVNGEPGKWKQMFAEVSTEAQRARLHGFTEQEVADARKEIQAGAERSVEQDATRSAQSILGEINGALAAGVTVTSAEEDLKVTKQLLPGITPAEVSKRFAETFDTSRPLTFSLQIPTSGEVPTEAQLVEIGTKALDVKPESEAETQRPTALMEKAPEAGALREFTEDPASHVWSGWLTNNVRVHYRFMDYKKDNVSVAITIAGGEIQETAENRGITRAGALAWSRKATSKLSSTDIRDLMTGKKVNAGGGPGGDCLVMAVGGSPAELETGMQLAYLLLTDPVVEQAGFDQWVKQQKLGIAQRKLDLDGAAAELMPQTLYPAGEVRVRPLDESQVDKLTPAAAQAWLRQILATGAIEVCVVGDIDREKAMDLVRRYIGSLPVREKINDKVFADLRGITPNAGPLKGERQVKTQTNQAIIIDGFFGMDPRNLEDLRLINMATKILTTRATDQIREKEQLAYSPGVGNAASYEYPALSMIAFASKTAPEKLDRLVQAVDSLYAAFSKDGPTAEEMETARKQFANTFDEQMREPSFWADKLRSLDYRGQTLAQIMEAPAAYQQFTAQQVKDAFNRYYKPERRFSITVSPANDGAKTAPEPGR